MFLRLTHKETASVENETQDSVFKRDLSEVSQVPKKLL